MALRGDGRAENQLPTQPRADLRRDLACDLRHTSAVVDWKQPHDSVEQRLTIDEQVERQDEQRDQPDCRSDGPREGTRDGADGRARRALNRFLEGEVMVQQPAFEQERLRVIEQVGELCPELHCLRHERRDDQNAQHDHEAGDREIHHENGQPAGQPRSADGHGLLMLDGVDQWTAPDRQQHADVDDEQRILGRVADPEDHDRKSRQGNEPGGLPRRVARSHAPARRPRSIRDRRSAGRRLVRRLRGRHVRLRSML